MTGTGGKRADWGRRLPSPALVLSVIALLLALSGTAAALKANSVASRHIVDGQVKTADLARGAVAQAKLAPGAVTRAKLAPGAVRRAAIRADSIAASHIAPGSLTGADIAPGALGAGHLVPNAVTRPKLADGAVSAPHVQSGALLGVDFAAQSIGLGALATNSVNSTKVVDNSLTGVDINEVTLAAPLLRDVSVHQATSPGNTNISKEAVATCPAGKVVVGGGGAIPNVGVIVASYPEGPTSWRVIGMRAGSSTAPWNVTARAICARA